MICCVPPTPRERQIGELFYFLQNKDKKSNVKELEYTLAAGSAEGAKSKELVIPLSDDKFKTNFAGYHVHYRILTLPCPDKEDTLIVKEEMTIMIDGDDSEPGLLTAQAMYENKGKDSVGTRLECLWSLRSLPARACWTRLPKSRLSTQRRRDVIFACSRLWESEVRRAGLTTCNPTVLCHRRQIFF